MCTPTPAPKLALRDSVVGELSVGAGRALDAFNSTIDGSGGYVAAQGNIRFNAGVVTTSVTASDAGVVMFTGTAFEPRPVKAGQTGGELLAPPVISAAGTSRVLLGSTSRDESYLYSVHDAGAIASVNIASLPVTSVCTGYYANASDVARVVVWGAAGAVVPVRIAIGWSPCDGTSGSCKSSLFEPQLAGGVRWIDSAGRIPCPPTHETHTLTVEVSVPPVPDGISASASITTLPQASASSALSPPPPLGPAGNTTLGPTIQPSKLPTSNPSGRASPSDPPTSAKPPVSLASLPLPSGVRGIVCVLSSMAINAL